MRGVNWTGIIYDGSTRCLPDEAINYVHSNNAYTPSTDTTSYNCQNNFSTSTPNTSNNSSLAENVDSVKRSAESAKSTTETVKDILKLF